MIVTSFNAGPTEKIQTNCKNTPDLLDLIRVKNHPNLGNVVGLSEELSETFTAPLSFMWRNEEINNLAQRP